MRFAMLIYREDGERSASPETEQELTAQLFAWFERWQSAGKISDSGVELQPRECGKVIRFGDGKRPMITDDRFLTANESVGGFIVLECADIDEAATIAATWPLMAGMHALEVRPLRQTAGPDRAPRRPLSGTG